VEVVVVVVVVMAILVEGGLIDLEVFPVQATNQTLINNNNSNSNIIINSNQPWPMLNHLG